MKKLAASLGALSTFVAATPVFAQQGFTVPEPQGFKIKDLGQFISAAIGVALVVAGIMVFVFLVWGGIQWIASGGDKGKTEEARARITAALIGLAIVASAWAVMQLIAYFFGIDVIGGTANLPRPY
jgi:hypothetical protein